MSHTCGYYRTQGLGLVWFVRQEKPGFVSHGDTGQHWRITSMCDTPRPAIPRDTHRGPQAPKGKAGAPLTPSAAWRACSPGRTSQHCCRRLCPSAAPRGPCTRGFLCRAQQHKTLITSTLSLGENSLKINILSIRQPSLGRINFNCFILLPIGFRGYSWTHSWAPLEAATSYCFYPWHIQNMWTFFKKLLNGKSPKVWQAGVSLFA